MDVRQSDLKTWMRCPLQYRWMHIDKLPREVGGSSVFGSVIHDCVLHMETSGDLNAAIRRFEKAWMDPTILDPEYVIDYFERGRSWRKFAVLGPKILSDWWSIIQWDTDLTLAREYTFDVPIGAGHRLTGTIDVVKVRYRADIDQYVLLISDYKTNAKTPTYDYLDEDLQFSAYAYASLQEEFWLGLFPHDPAHARKLMSQYQDLPRYGEWVQLQGPKRMDAGPRTERHFNRLVMAVNALCESVAMRIFVPTISGEACRFCEYRSQCGLPELMDN